MTATFTLDQLSRLSGSRIVENNHKESVSQGRFTVSTDSRQAGGSCIYLALKGERFDGHSFVAAAVQAGAPICIISAAAEFAVVESLQKIAPESRPLLCVVPDTLAAYQQLATIYRLQVGAKVIAVTGSSGKTTTKEMCGAVFSSKACFKSAQNENNEIGVPKTILAMPDTTRFLIVEMGMRGLGQIAELAACALPDIGIITSVGVAHIELLGSRENIARAKCELLKYLNVDTGAAVLGQPDGLLVEEAHRTFNGKILAFPRDQFKVTASTADSTSFVFDQSGQTYTVHAHGSVLLQDAWCAVQAALLAGLTPEEAAAGLAQWRAVEGRGNAVSTKSGALLVDESYNSNPDSVRCAVEAILSKEAFPQAEKIVVLGEMLELGDFSDQLHSDLGQWLKDKEISTLLTVGPQAARIAEAAEGAPFQIVALADLASARTHLEKMMKADSCVMVKGSHGTKLYELVGSLLA